MAISNRAALITKTHRVLKKRYKPTPLDPARPVLQQVLYACCLQNARCEAADKAFAALEKAFFDWNEIRVSTVKELAEVMDVLPDPLASASSIKRVLQSVFEATYSFDLEFLRKENLGKAAKKLGAIDGANKFIVSCAVQSSLGGHSIPIDDGAAGVLQVIGVVSPADAQAHVAPGLERAIPKSKGIEFGSLLHQLGADFHANCYSPVLQKVLLTINEAARDRLPKRPSKTKKKTTKAPAKTAPTKKMAATKSQRKAATAKGKKAPTKKKTSAKKSGSKKISKRKPR